MKGSTIIGLFWERFGHEDLMNVDREGLAAPRFRAEEGSGSGSG